MEFCHTAASRLDESQQYWRPLVRLNYSLLKEMRMLLRILGFQNLKMWWRISTVMPTRHVLKGIKPKKVRACACAAVRATEVAARGGLKPRVTAGKGKELRLALSRGQSRCRLCVAGRHMAFTGLGCCWVRRGNYAVSTLSCVVTPWRRGHLEVSPLSCAPTPGLHRNHTDS